MRTKLRKTAQLGELIVAVFDKAARYSTDPLEVSRLATKAIAHILRHARRASLSLSAPAAHPTTMIMRRT